MEGYFSAVRKMEQTVMFPSLLREVSLDEHESGREAELGDKDLYDYFSLLKNIKQTVEGGLLALDTQNSHLSTGLREQEGQKEADLEGLFYYHVSGLCRVLTQLTEGAKTVTSRYNQIMGQINHSNMSLGW
ncbi:mid1-interacting protein 1-B-like [Sphaerodactylus townsendi]|uniref:mid1-interacting protein 1-B-like n=1 Tax=Sphaerodactylus townsendi TaxID=933632 RepID=UPI002026CBB1|nr:mid1-interacting protein 1-B-like [Sphaerodactylus townsendi]